MTITPEAMRELADRLDIYPNHPIDATSKAAAAMLRSIAAERDKFDRAYVIDSRGVTHRKFTIIFDDGSQPKGAE